MKFDIQQSEGWTDKPRELTYNEKCKLRGLSRLDAVKLYREMTRARLGVAIRFVDNFHM